MIVFIPTYGALNRNEFYKLFSTFQKAEIDDAIQDVSIKFLNKYQTDSLDVAKKLWYTSLKNKLIDYTRKTNSNKDMLNRMPKPKIIINPTILNTPLLKYWDLKIENSTYFTIVCERFAFIRENEIDKKAKPTIYSNSIRINTPNVPTIESIRNKYRELFSIAKEVQPMVGNVPWFGVDMCFMGIQTNLSEVKIQLGFVKEWRVTKNHKLPRIVIIINTDLELEEWDFKKQKLLNKAPLVR